MSRIWANPSVPIAGNRKRRMTFQSSQRPDWLKSTADPVTIPAKSATRT
jgi:hypothetical protein